MSIDREFSKLREYGPLLDRGVVSLEIANVPSGWQTAHEYGFIVLFIAVKRLRYRRQPSHNPGRRCPRWFAGASHSPYPQRLSARRQRLLRHRLSVAIVLFKVNRRYLFQVRAGLRSLPSPLCRPCVTLVRSLPSAALRRCQRKFPAIMSTDLFECSCSSSD